MQTSPSDPVEVNSAGPGSAAGSCPVSRGIGQDRGISQDIGVPLNRLMAAIEQLRACAPGHQRDIFEALQAHAGLLAHRVNGLVDLIHMEAENFELESIDFDPRASLEGVLAQASAEAERRGAVLRSAITKEMPALLRGDPARWKQAVHDLLMLAIEAGANGEVQIALETGARPPSPFCASGAEAPEEPKVLAQLPSGEQQPSQKRPQAGSTDVLLRAWIRCAALSSYPDWLRASLSAATVSRSGGSAAPHGYPARAGLTASIGTPLGLVLVQRIAHLMGGAVELAQEPSGRESLCLTLRMQLGSVRAPAAPPVFPGVLRGLKALLVDPQVASRQMLKEFLEGWGVLVDEAGSTAAALGKLSLATSGGEPFRLVLLDDGMSGPTGFDLAQQIKECEDLGDTTVVLLTANGMRGDAARCRQVGVSAYLTKPIRASRLLEALALALGSGVEPESELITRHSLREARQGESEWPVADGGEYVGLRGEERDGPAQDGRVVAA